MFKKVSSHEGFGAGNVEKEIQINTNVGAIPDVNAFNMHQILIQRNGYTAGLFTVTGYAAGSDIEEVVYEADGTTPMVINIADGSYFTRVIAPVAYDKIKLVAASTAGTPDSNGGWKAYIISGYL